VVTAVILDLVAEWRFRRRHGALVPVWPLHRLYAVDPALDLLHAAGIPAHPRSVHARTLLQFFAPYLPVDLLVPEADAARARALLSAQS
jgi:hypothetical protein